MRGLLEVSDLGLPVSWAVLKAGLSPVLPGGPWVSTTEVIPFAEMVLGASENPSDAIIDLATSSPTDREGIDRALDDLSPGMASEGVGARIWRAVALHRCIAQLPHDPVEALLSITEFWLDWGWPNDMPSSIRERPNGPAGSEYSPDRLIDVLQDTQGWLSREVRSLSQS